MALQIPQAAMVRVIYTLAAGGVQENVLGAVVQTNITFDQALANTLGSAIKSAFTSTGMAARTHTSVSLASVGVRDLRNANLTEFLDQSAAVPGTATGDVLPRQTAFCITLRTANSGKSFRGRVYLGGFAEADNDTDGSASTALLTAGPAFVTAIGTAMTNNGMALGVLSRPALAYDVTTVIHTNDGEDLTSVKHHNGRPGQVTRVTLIQARNDTWDSQRRRTTPGSASSLLLAAVTHDLDSGQSYTRGKASGGAVTPARR